MIQVNAYESNDGRLYKTASEANRADKLLEFSLWYGEHINANGHPLRGLIVGKYTVTSEKLFEWLTCHYEEIQRIFDKK